MEVVSRRLYVDEEKCGEMDMELLQGMNTERLQHSDSYLLRSITAQHINVCLCLVEEKQHAFTNVTDAFENTVIVSW